MSNTLKMNSEAYSEVFRDILTDDDSWRGVLDNWDTPIAEIETDTFRTAKEELIFLRGQAIAYTRYLIDSARFNAAVDQVLGTEWELVIEDLHKVKNILMKPVRKLDNAIKTIDKKIRGVDALTRQLTQKLVGADDKTQAVITTMIADNEETVRELTTARTEKTAERHRVYEVDVCETGRTIKEECEIITRRIDHARNDKTTKHGVKTWKIVRAIPNAVRGFEIIKPLNPKGTPNKRLGTDRAANGTQQSYYYTKSGQRIDVG